MFFNLNASSAQNHLTPVFWCQETLCCLVDSSAVMVGGGNFISLIWQLDPLKNLSSQLTDWELKLTLKVGSF